MPSVSGLLHEPLPKRLSIPFELNAQSVQAQGLVGWWPIVGSKSGYVPGYARSQRPLIPTAPPIAVVPHATLGEMLLFNGTTQDVTSLNGAIPVFQQTTPFSTSFWFATTDTSASLVQSFSWFSLAGWYTECISGAITMVLANSTAGNFRMAKTTATTFANGALYHVVGTYSGNSSNTGIQFYVNGQAVAMTLGTNTSPGTLASSRIQVANGPGGLMAGTIADIRVYDRQLSAAEAWAMFAPQTRWELYRPLVWPSFKPGGPATVTATPGAVALTAALPALTPIVQALPTVVGLAGSMPAATPVLRALPSVVGASLSVLSPTPILRATPSAVAQALNALTATPILQTQPSAVALAAAVLAATPVARALPAAVPLSLAFPAPAIPRTVTADTVALSLSAQTATPVLRTLPSTIALVAALQAAQPTIQTLPNAVALVLALLAPTIQTGAGVTVSPAAIALVLAALAPTPILRALPAALALALGVSAASPTVQARPDLVALLLSVLAPAAGKTATPAAVALALQALAPQLTVQVQPSAVALLLDVLAVAMAAYAALPVPTDRPGTGGTPTDRLLGSGSPTDRLLGSGSPTDRDQATGGPTNRDQAIGGPTDRSY